ncbi:MAG TPA: hypothetical protein VF702_11745 [Allosphingosinicella sp.]
MKTAFSCFVLLGLLAAPAAAAADNVPAPAQARFQGLFVDWSAASRQSIEAEREALQRPAAAPTENGAGSVALGERVGEIVALGDCAEGERIARAAGDFALVAAVRRHCTAADPQR